MGMFSADEQEDLAAVVAASDAVTKASEEIITKVAKICLTADSWCSSCQDGLFNQLREAFPGQIAAIDAVYQRKEEYKTIVDVAWEDLLDGKPEKKIWEIKL